MGKAQNTKEKHAKALAKARKGIQENEEKKVTRRRGALPGNGGAPFKLDEDDMKELYALAAIGCTFSEIAEYLAVDVTCLEKNKTYLGLIRDGKENFKRSLRRMQYANAKEGNTSMLIWLGKQILGQRDKMDTETTTINPLLEKALSGKLASGKDLVKAREEDKEFKEV